MEITLIILAVIGKKTKEVTSKIQDMVLNELIKEAQK